MTDVQLTPYLSPHDCAAANAFYEKAFGAVETGARFTDPEGRIGYSEISIGAPRSISPTCFLPDTQTFRPTERWAMSHTSPGRHAMGS